MPMRVQLALGVMYRVFRSVSQRLRVWPSAFLTCYKVNRGGGAKPVQSCEGTCTLSTLPPFYSLHSTLYRLRVFAAIYYLLSTIY